MVEQCRAAIAWLYRNAAELEIDATRMHLAGHGTGGHLAMMAVAKPWRSFELLGNPVQSALALGGIYDLAPVRLSYLNGALQLDAESCETLSPIYRPAPLACRVLVASGGRESLEYRRQAHASRRPGAARAAPSISWNYPARIISACSTGCRNSTARSAARR